MKKRIRFLITIALLCILAVLLFYHFSNNTTPSGNTEEETTVHVSEVDKLISKDLDKNYPITVREVVDLFTRIQICYYNEDCSSDEIVKLAYMATILFDDELNANNPFDEYYDALVDDINQYMEEGKIISRVIIDKASDVIYSTVDDTKYASINCIYYLKTSDTTEKITETYILRKDGEGRWKILGWKLYEEKEE
ncbi:MAG: hypothetical protein IIX45_03310 [Lachnospiraceae bacterium]|nr:hypothetical protein [Lachnospiraceae bacterium]